MSVHDYNKNLKVYFSANDRITKQVADNIFEVFHINVIDNNNILSIKTIDLSGMSFEDINKYLDTCGLKLTQSKIIAHKMDEKQIIEKNAKLINYTLADRLSISGAAKNTINYEFEDAKDLNELLLEHDIPYKFDMTELRTL